MVWGATCNPHATYLVDLKKTKKKNGKKESISSTDYINQILAPHLAPWYNALKDQEIRLIFIQDNITIHGPKDVRDSEIIRRMVMNLVLITRNSKLGKKSKPIVGVYPLTPNYWSE